MKQGTIALLLSIGTSAASVLGNQVPSNFPRFTAPATANIVSVHGYGGGLPTQPASSDPVFAMGAYYRLTTTLAAGTVGDHFAKQLTSLGWQAMLRQDHGQLSLVRFASGSGNERFIGMLTAVTFPATENALVAIDLMRPRLALGGRSGGGGAGRMTELTISLPDATTSEVPFPESARLPATAASRVEEIIRGGAFDSSHTETRLNSTSTPADLMKIIERQITARGWAVDLRAGDSMQAVTKFNPVVGGDSTAILILTALPGTSEVSVILNVLKNRR